MADRDAGLVSAAVAEPRFDPLDPGVVADPYPHYAALRDRDPVHRSDLLCGWIVSRFDDVNAVLRDQSMSSDVRRATPTVVTQLEIEALEEHSKARQTIVHMDDPDHARVRSLMAEPFRVRQIGRLAPLVTERVAAAVDHLYETYGDGEVELDLVSDFAYPLPVEIFSTWLGMPPEAHPQFREWTSWVARSRDPLPPDERARFFVALDAMHDYLAEQAEAKRRAPTDDLLSYLVHAHEGEARLSHEELMAQLVTLYMAGHEPTAGLVGNGVLALLDHPDQLVRLRSEPGLVPNAVSELLRFDGPNQFVRRITTRPTVVGGVEMPAGTVLYPGLASANRDPRRWGDDAETVVVDRADADRHLQFAVGAHACLGSHLARLQAEHMLAAVLAHLEDLELAGEPVWSNRVFIRGLASLPVRATLAPR
ncbi:MAG TPA: cytochrome P450 [Acidimicrobiales bacterium]|nr:cytochrome P450 [Acidimicrobiales bacterium]